MSYSIISNFAFCILYFLLVFPVSYSVFDVSYFEFGNSFSHFQFIILHVVFRISNVTLICMPWFVFPIMPFIHNFYILNYI